MPLSFSMVFKLIWHFFLVITYLFLILPNGVQAMNGNRAQLRIGVIVDSESRIGKEQKTALEVAVQKFNNVSKRQKISLYFTDPSPKGPLQAAFAAEELVKGKGVNVIIGMDRWEEAASVADIGSQAKVPVLSFSAPATTPPFAQTRWPFLVRMAHNDTEQVKCIAALLQSHNWRRVVLVYEDNMYGGDSGTIALLTGTLQEIGSEIEYQLVLPPFHLLSDPKEVVKEELRKLQNIKSRVFIVFQTSFPMMIHLFREAKEMRFVERDCVWILTDGVAGFLDSLNTSVIYSMEGALGIRNYYPEDSSSYRHFYLQFQQLFRNKYPKEDNVEPGFYAVRAYDSITTIIKAVERFPGNDIYGPKILLKKILSSNFAGLSARIQFKDGQLSDGSILRIVNVVGKKYKELDFWLPGFGFSMNIDAKNAAEINGTTNGTRLEGLVFWPGGPKWDPKGWAMPTQAKPMIIGVPGRTSFEKFVKVENASGIEYEGFCIELFRKVHDLLEYPLYYNFTPYNGTYDDLVNHVYNKTYDAIVGDVTILANRSNKVEFTQPYLQSGLSMIVPAKEEESAWMFTKPFTLGMWLATGAMLIFTMLVVWFLERQNNPEFSGSWRNQIGTAMMFTFSSLFFAHREKLYNNLTRVVLIIWLFVVLILSSSYTASLSSMLTIRQLEPNITDIDWLIKTNAKIGCDGDSFVRIYLEQVLRFKPENVINISNEYDYPKEFRSGNISAAFLELPYEKVFINTFCKHYAATTPPYRFGGLGFVFQKGSPIAADVSRAILTLLENGTVRSLEDKWFAPSKECSSSNSTDSDTTSLSLQSFWGLYVISGATSTICILLFLIGLVKKYIKHQEEESRNGNAAPGDVSVWDKASRLASFIYNGENATKTCTQSCEADEWTSSSRPSISSPENLAASSSPEIELARATDQSRT